MSTPRRPAPRSSGAPMSATGLRPFSVTGRKATDDARGFRAARRIRLAAVNVVVTGRSLTLDEVVRVARGGAHVDLAPEALAAMREGRAVVEAVLERGDSVYGLSTAVAERKAVPVTAEEQQEPFNRLL